MFVMLIRPNKAETAVYSSLKFPGDLRMVVHMRTVMAEHRAYCSVFTLP